MLWSLDSTRETQFQKEHNVLAIRFPQLSEQVMEVVVLTSSIEESVRPKWMPRVAKL